jgi:hypothetical protein
LLHARIRTVACASYQSSGDGSVDEFRGRLGSELEEPGQLSQGAGSFRSAVKHCEEVVAARGQTVFDGDVLCRAMESAKR